jgi:hypothetical protein
VCLSGVCLWGVSLEGCLWGVSLGCVTEVCHWGLSPECVSEVCLWGVSLDGCLWGVSLGCVTEVCHWGVSLWGVSLGCVSGGMSLGSDPCISLHKKTVELPDELRFGGGEHPAVTHSTSFQASAHDAIHPRPQTIKQELHKNRIIC